VPDVGVARLTSAAGGRDHRWAERPGSTSTRWPAATGWSLVVVTTPDDQRWLPRSAHQSYRTRPARSRSTAGGLERSGATQVAIFDACDQGHELLHL